MAEVETHDHQRNGSITAALTTGIIGTGLGLLNGTGGIGNILGGNNNQYVTKESFDLAMQIAAKDSEIALLKSEQNTEIKIADVYERVMTRVNQDQRDQAAVNAQQGVYNGVNTATLNCMQNSISALLSMTKQVIPADNVCPKPMPQYNSWTAPTTPTTAG